MDEVTARRRALITAAAPMIGVVTEGASTLAETSARPNFLPSLQTAFRRIGDRTFDGYVFDQSDPTRKFVVEILVDGYSVRTARADGPTPISLGFGFGDGCYGFVVSLDAAALNESAWVEARVANLALPIGPAIELDDASSETAEDIAGPGEARWLGGLRFSGSLGERAAASPLRVEVDGLFVDQVGAFGWRHVGEGDNSRPARGFDFHLPDRFADGAVHRLTVRSEQGEPLEGTPIAFLALPQVSRTDRVASQGADARDLTETIRHRLWPTSAPFSDYPGWRAQFPPPCGRPSQTPIAVVMIGGDGADDTIDTLREQTHGLWVAAALPSTGGALTFDPREFERFLEGDAAESEIILCCLAGSLLFPTALQRVANALRGDDDAAIAYADFDAQSADGSSWPLALSAFDYERMLEQGYCAYFFAMDHKTVKQSLGAGATDLYRLFNAALDEAPAVNRQILHLPGAIGVAPPFDAQAATLLLSQASCDHLARRSARADAAPLASGAFPHVRIRRTPSSLRATVVIPTRNRADLLKSCLASIRPAVARSRADLLIVDNDSDEAETLDFLRELEAEGAAVLRARGPFNYAAMMNSAAATVSRDILCFLNNDVKAIDEHWLEEMLGRLADASVGAVGALLTWPSRVVQHGGVVLGPGFSAVHAFGDRLGEEEGYGGLLRAAHECSAATAACLVLRRTDYKAVGGMDALRFPVNFNDVDLCLKLRAAGKRIVVTPYARLEHLESASRGRSPHRIARLERELRLLRMKWGEALAADPYYNPVLSLDAIPFSALALPPRGMTPRRNEPPIPRDLFPGF